MLPAMILANMRIKIHIFYGYLVPHSHKVLTFSEVTEEEGLLAPNTIYIQLNN
jgi:hypothetical protein